MAVASPSIGVIRAQIRAIRGKVPDAKVFGIFSPGRWSGPTDNDSGSEQIAVYQCDSPLQMRLAMQSMPESATAAVLVTPLDQGKVSDDILVRLAMRKLHPINSWEIVRSLFKARHLDPRITRHAFLADLLLDYAGTRDVQPVAGGLVDAETVWGILLTHLLGLSGSHPDVVELLRQTAESDLAGRWSACTPQFRDAARQWINETAGDAAGAVLGCIEGEHGPEALAVGLVMGVVYHDAIGHELDKAAGRLETYVGTTHLSEVIAKQWRDAATAAAGQLTKATLRRSLDEAESIIVNIGAMDHAWRSNELTSGFEQRLSRLGKALTAHVDARATTLPKELLEVYDGVLLHRLGLAGGRQVERVEMAIRLSRWLADRNAGNAAAASNLQTIAQGYATDGGFVDWSRRVLRGGEPNKDLAAAFVHLVDEVTKIRETENLAFGKAVADEQAAGDTASGLVPVEQMLDHVVAKAAEAAPVLLLIVDGMSWAVFRELLRDIRSHDWIELGFGPEPKRMVGLSALPSVTEASRTSLLCGSLTRGQATNEVKGFAAHQALAALSQPGRAPKLFHKAALEGNKDNSLAGEIRDALADKKQRVVGIVVNAVDDYLDKGDQIDAIWTMQHIRVLEPILAEAGAAGRMVVLLSDHGHILDRQTEGRDATDGQRWRRPDGKEVTGELEISSPRVVMPEGGRITVPWTERLRYGQKKNGYHGGATPQEMLIPISILWPELRLPDGLSELPAELPSWWTEPAVARATVTVIEQSTDSVKTTPPPSTLFDKPEAPDVTTPQAEPWIADLLQSDVFAVQKKLAGRVRVEDAMLQQLLVTLASRGGSITAPALAVAIGVSEHRLPGMLAIMQRLLNVEGYTVLDRQETANTIVLNVPLLKKQFELD